jgi:glycerol-3-phosphate dehydrogenase (NAD(P)+)
MCKNALSKLRKLNQSNWTPNLSLQNSVTVLGAGSYGTALAFCLARNQVATYLWGRDSEQMGQMAQARCNTRYLPDAKFPDKLHIEADLKTAVSLSRDLLIVTPSHGFADLLKRIKPMLKDQQRIVWASKGLEPETGRLLQEVAEEILGTSYPLAVLSGPTFAKEMVAGLPTAISLSATDSDFAKDFAAKLHSNSFRVYQNQDLIGVQLGGAVKNVIAIGAGLADGIGFGANARTALITRGLAELTRLGLALGAQAETFMGMSCLGDLVLTCTDNQSRNRRFGLALGQGLTVEQAISSIGQVVEGYRNTTEVHILAARMGVEMPICEQIFKVLYDGKSPKDAALALLGRERKSE